jgi:hypothetical protein
MRLPKKTKYGDYATWLYFDVFAKYQVRIIFTDDLMKSTDARITKMPSTNADACVYNTLLGRSYIFLKNTSPPGTVAHEAWHVVRNIFTYVGVKKFDDETVAYHLDYLVEAIYKFKEQILKAEKENEPSKPRTSSAKRN